MINRRVLLAGASALVAFSRIARGQPTRTRRLVGVLMGDAEGDSAVGEYIEQVRAGLRTRGWTEPENVGFAVRLTDARNDLAEHSARELVQLGSDVVVSSTAINTSALLSVTPNTPIIFLSVENPVELGFVRSYAEPGGSATGFSGFVPSHAGKWLELLLRTAPHLRRVGFIFNPAESVSGGSFYLPVFEAAALDLGVEAIAIPVNDVTSIARAMFDFAGVQLQVGDALGGLGAPLVQNGLVVAPDAFLLAVRRVLVSIVARYRFPAIYPNERYTDIGGLLSYSIDTLDLFRRAGEYAGRVLGGESASTLPVQTPTRFRLVVNLEAAGRLGLEVPLPMLAAAYRVIE